MFPILFSDSSKNAGSLGKTWLFANSFVYFRKEMWLNRRCEYLSTVLPAHLRAADFSHGRIE